MTAPNPLKERREAVHYASKRGLSQRRSCSLVALSRSTARYVAHGPDDSALVEKIQTIQAQHPRYGVRRVFVQLRKKGETINHKRVQRVMNVYSLQVVRRKPRKTIRTGVTVPERAEYPDHVWTIDFQKDALIDGRKVRLLNILDEFNREWLAVVVGGQASAKTVMAALSKLFRERAAPRFLRSDNGGVFIAGNLANLLSQTKVTAKFIAPGSPWHTQLRCGGAKRLC